MTDTDRQMVLDTAVLLAKKIGCECSVVIADNPKLFSCREQDDYPVVMWCLPCRIAELDGAMIESVEDRVIVTPDGRVTTIGEIRKDREVIESKE